MVSRVSSLLAVAAFACTGTERVQVDTPNNLGIVSLDTHRFSEAGNEVFVLTGLSASDEERASVRITRGMVAFSSTERAPGSEIVAAAGRISSRAVTREIRELAFGSSLFRTPELIAFLSLPAVVKVLDTEASIAVTVVPTSDERGYSWIADNCDGADLNTSPTAHECCEDTNWSTHKVYDTTFFRADQSVSVRIAGYDSSGHRLHCAAQNGGACSGNACYWGPNGFARAIIIAPTDSYAHILDGVVNDYQNCEYSFDGYSYSSAFYDQTGSFPTGQGCPGGQDGAGEWDY